MVEVGGILSVNFKFLHLEIIKKNKFFKKENLFDKFQKRCTTTFHSVLHERSTRPYFNGVLSMCMYNIFRLGWPLYIYFKTNVYMYDML